MGEAAKEVGVYKDKSVCKIHPGCEHWNSGMGSNACFQCKKLERAVDIDPIRPSFILPEELKENTQASPEIRSLMEGMRGLSMKDKLVFIEFTIDRPISGICEEYNISRAGLYKLVERVKKQIRHNLGLEK